MLYQDDAASVVSDDLSELEDPELYDNDYQQLEHRRQYSSVIPAEILLPTHDDDEDFPNQIPLSIRLLRRASHDGDLAMVNHLMNSEQVNIRHDRVEYDIREPTALMLAAEKGHVKIVQRLLKANALVNHPHPQGPLFPAIFFAALGGHLDVVELLLAAGAQTIATVDDDWQVCAVVEAAEYGHTHVVQRLALELSATSPHGRPDWQLVWTSHKTPRGQKSSLMAAIDNNHVDTLKCLLDLGHPPDLSYTLPMEPLAEDAPEETTALVHAVECNALECVRVLLEYGADVRWGEYNAVRSAAWYNHLDVLELLLNAAPSKFEAKVAAVEATMGRNISTDEVQGLINRFRFENLMAGDGDGNPPPCIFSLYALYFPDRLQQLTYNLPMKGRLYATISVTICLNFQRWQAGLALLESQAVVIERIPDYVLGSINSSLLDQACGRPAQWSYDGLESVVGVLSREWPLGAQKAMKLAARSGYSQVVEVWLQQGARPDLALQKLLKRKMESSYNQWIDDGLLEDFKQSNVHVIS